MAQSNSGTVHRDALFVDIGVGLAESVKLGILDAGFCRNRFQLAQEGTVRFALTVREHQFMRLGIPLSHSVVDFPNELCRNRNESVLGRFLFLLAFEAEMPPRLRLHVQRAFLPVEVSIFRVLHFCIANPGIQEQTVEQFFFLIHGRKERFEFLLRVVGKRLPQEIGTGEIGEAAPAPEMDLLVAASFAFADLPIECDCHIASTD